MRTRSSLLVLASLLLLGVLASSATAKNDEEEVRAANLNLLHGFACDPAAPDDGDQCRVRDRIDLLFQHIERADCP